MSRRLLAIFATFAMGILFGVFMSPRKLVVIGTPEGRNEKDTNVGESRDLGSDRLKGLPDCTIPLNGTLADLSAIYQPTKFGYVDGVHKYRHVGFQRIYPLWLEQYRTKKFKMLEIGLDSGRGSLLWKAYFPCGELWGLEYSAGFTDTSGANAINTIQGDQGDPKFLKEELISRSGGGFAVIIDDGGHHYEQQKTSYEILFEHALNPGGVYIIEDIETSYWKEGVSLYGNPITRGGQSEQGTLVNQFKKVVDVVNKKFYDNDYVVFGSVDHWIQQLTFVSNAIILLKKDRADCLYEEAYTWPHNLAADCPAREQKEIKTHLDAFCRTFQ